jgi:hypothetical protein
MDADRDAMWTAYKSAASREEFRRQFDAMPVAKEIKRQLWFAKFPEAAAAPKPIAVDPPKPAPAPKQAVRPISDVPKPQAKAAEEPGIIDRALGVVKETGRRVFDWAAQGNVTGAAAERAATPLHTPTEEELGQITKENAKAADIAAKPVVPLSRLAPSKPKGAVQNAVAGALRRAEQYTTPPVIAGGVAAATLLPVLPAAVGTTAMLAGGASAVGGAGVSWYEAAKRLSGGDRDGAAQLVGEGATDALIGALMLRASKSGATKAFEYLRSKFPKTKPQPAPTPVSTPEGQSILDAVIAQMEQGAAEAPKPVGGGGTPSQGGGKATKVSSQQPIETGSVPQATPEVGPAAQPTASPKPAVEVFQEPPRPPADILSAAVDATGSPLDAAVRVTPEPPLPRIVEPAPSPSLTDAMVIQALADNDMEDTPENRQSIQQAMEASDPADFLSPQSYQRFFGVPEPPVPPRPTNVETIRELIAEGKIAGKQADDILSAIGPQEPPRPISDIAEPPVPPQVGSRTAEADGVRGVPEGDGVPTSAIAQADGSPSPSPEPPAPPSVEADRGAVTKTALAPEAVAQARGIAAIDEDAAQVYAADVDEIGVDPVRFQFKSNTGAGGVTDEYKGVKWNPRIAGVIAVWRDPANGKLFVVNGHHRLDMAKANGVKKINVVEIQAGSAQEARGIGALINIADNKGNAVDAAKVLRDMGYDNSILSEFGIAPKTNLAKYAMALRDLTPEVFNQVTQGEMDIEPAAAIGMMLSDPQHQVSAANLIQRAAASGKRLTTGEIERLVNRARNAPRVVVEDKQIDLFGNDVHEQDLAVDIAILEEYVAKQLAKEKRLFSSVGSGSAAEKLGKAGNTIKAEENAKIAQETAEALEAYNKLSDKAGPVSRVLQDGAIRIARGDNPNKVREDVYEAVRAAIADTFKGRNKADDTGSNPVVADSGSDVQPTGGASVRVEPEAPVSGTAQVAEPPKPPAEPPKPPTGEQPLLGGPELQQEIASFNQSRDAAKLKAQMQAELGSAIYQGDPSAMLERDSPLFGGRPIDDSPEQGSLLGAEPPKPPKDNGSVVEPSADTYREKLFDIGMRIRDSKPVADGEIAALKPADAEAMRRLQYEYRPRPARQPEPVKVVKQKNGVEVVDGKFSSIDDPDDYFYHVTTTDRARSILSSGELKPNASPSMAEGFYRTYSRGKVFFSDRNGVSYWQERIESHLADQYDRPPKLTVLRFRKSAVKSPVKDDLGAKDSNAPSYYVAEPISLALTEPPKPPEPPKPKAAKPKADPTPEEELKQVRADIEKWKSKSYQTSDRVVYTKSTQDVGNVTAINEGRRRKKIAELEAKAKELEAKLAEPPKPPR